MEEHDAEWSRLEAWLERLLDLAPEQARAALEGLPEEVRPLRARLEAALAAAHSDSGPLDHPSWRNRTAWLGDAPAHPLAPGAVLGAWQIEGELGRGGMGTVFAVRRADGAWEQHAALKLLSASADLPSTRARFLQERRILARLDHPGIARLLDGGVAPDGRPWLVLERVDGRPLTAHADAQALPVEARLELFSSVLEAVGFAHRNLVVHRDLKPSNILVTDAGEVKLLDFGIAKLLDADAASDLTRTAAPLTPQYAAPEQILGEPITTATDIYALGLILCELLAGAKPYRITTGSALEIERAILTSEPRPPSRLAREHPEAAAARGTTPRRLTVRLAGDLDAIVARAIARDPAARYPSAEALAHDLDAHRAGRPIRARRERAAARLWKLARRHRVGAAAAAALAATLVAGMIAAAVALAQSRARLAEAERAEAIQEFLLGLFGEVDPERSLGREVPLREIVDRGAVRLESELRGQPRARAELLLTLGTIYRRLALYDEAERLLAQALTLSRSEFGPRSGESARVLAALGDLAYWRDDFARALDLHREALATFSAADPPSRSELASAEYNVGSALRQLGRFEEALDHERRALEVEQELHGEASLPHAAVELGIALLLRDLGRPEEAIAPAARALSTRRQRLPEGHPGIADALEALALASAAAGDVAPAVEALEECLAIRRRVFGSEHPEVLEALNSLASALEEGEHFADAQRVRDEALAQARRILPAGSDSLAVHVNNSAVLAFRAERFEAAADGFREAVAIWRFTAGETSPRVGTARSNLGFALLELGRPREAKTELTAALEIRSATAGESSPEVAQTLRILGLTRLALDERAAAREALERAVELSRTAYPPRHLRLAEALVSRSGLAIAEGRAGEARRDLEEALAIREERLGEDNPLTSRLREELARLASPR
ncbi:MAG: serine/threonine-protein kinase [Thermoanaerobaculia bacterium]|jgi:serine/threonine-protein kinase|nr:serine/threonine-protein kinase [Thermoanaerobaculia bacterium]